MQMVYAAHGYLQQKGPERNEAHRVRCHLYFILSDVQLKDAMEFAYKNSIKVGATPGANCKTAKLVEIDDEEGENLEREETADGPRMQNYLISSESPEK